MEMIKIPGNDYWKQGVTNLMGYLSLRVSSS